MTMCGCGVPVVRCPDYRDGCKVRHLSYDDVGRPVQSARMRCQGWVHVTGWHMCDPASDPALLAGAA